MNRQPNITMIDELPDVDQLVDQGMGNNDRVGYGYGNADEKLQKFIRPSHKITPEAGMAPYGAFRGGPKPPIVEIPIQEMNIMAPPPHIMPISCIDIANHIQNCPICSKFYKNDTSIHMIVIITLAIICVLLLKRVLNV
jgi:hypothetical protein